MPYAILLALLTAAAPAPAQTQVPALGRLFASPAEREQLDRQRGGRAAVVPGEAEAAAAAASAQAAAAAIPPPPPPEPVVLNGIVRRSSGKSTVWLNQTPQNEPHNSLEQNSALSLRLSSGQQVILKPGQRFDLNNGTVKEGDAP